MTTDRTAMEQALAALTRLHENSDGPLDADAELIAALRARLEAQQEGERATFEEWRETATWYVVSKPDPDEDKHSDAATTFRLMNIAAHEAWQAALASQGAAEQPQQPDAHPVAGEHSGSYSATVLNALRHAEEWIDSREHGDNCYVSNHYEGDPGNRCNCGKTAVSEAILEARLQVDPEYVREITGEPLEAPSRKSAAGDQKQDVQDLTASERAQLERDAARYRWMRKNLGVTVSHWFCTQGGEPLDAAIDAALGKPQ